MQNNSRRLTVALDEGSTDGKYRKNRPDVGGNIEPTTESNRRALHPYYGYGTFAEAPLMKRPDGVTARHER